MPFKEVIYNNYVRNHTRPLYGTETLDGIRKHFPVWDYYYGRLLPPNKDAQMLDIGCGKGSFVFYLQQRGYHRALGIDLSEEQVEYGRSLGISNILSADVHHFLSDKKGAYDCITAFDVLEHFTRQEVFCDQPGIEARRMLYHAITKRRRAFLYKYFLWRFHARNRVHRILAPPDLPEYRFQSGGLPSDRPGAQRDIFNDQMAALADHRAENALLQTGGNRQRERYFHAKSDC